MTHYILTAAGDGSRWQNHLGVRKHLAPICGEPIIARTIRLIRENDPESVVYIAISPNHPILIPDCNFYDGTTYKKNTESDRYFCSEPYWNLKGKTVLIWGDVFFTKDVIKSICSNTEPFMRWARPGGNTNKGYGEEFALSFYPEQHDSMIDSMQLVEDISLRNNIQLYGAVYLAMMGLSENKIIRESGSGRKNNFGNQIDINDETDDFDFPRDYDKFVRTWKNDA